MGRLGLTASAALACAVAGASGQILDPGNYLMVAETDDDRVMLFDAFNGSLIDADFLLMDDIVEAWTGSAFDSARTPINAIQVGQEIWVGDNGEDSIFRVDINTGSVIGRVGGSTSDFMGTGGLSDIRGMDVLNDRVYVVNDGGSNGAPGDDTIVFVNATTGAIEGGFGLRGEAEDVLVMGDELWVTNRDGNTSIGDGTDDTIDIYNLEGEYLRTFAQGGTFGTNEFNSPQQIVQSSNGILLASESFPAGIFEFGLDGTQLDSFLSGVGVLGSLGNIQGVYELGNGNIIFSVNNLGVYTFDRVTGEVVLQAEGDPLLIEGLTIVPAPAPIALFGVLGLVSARRRR